MKKLLIVLVLALTVVAGSGCSLNPQVEQCKGTVLQLDNWDHEAKIAYTYQGQMYTDEYQFSHTDLSIFNNLKDGEQVTVFANQNYIHGVLPK